LDAAVALRLLMKEDRERMGKKKKNSWERSQH